MKAVTFIAVCLSEHNKKLLTFSNMKAKYYITLHSFQFHLSPLRGENNLWPF